MMKLKLSDITALGRVPGAPSYPTNLAIAGLSLIVALAGAIWQLVLGTALLESVLWGIGAGFLPFLTWALGRELDPDHDLSAFVGTLLVLIAFLLPDMPSLLVIAWLLLVLRIVNRSVGLPAKPWDSLGLLGLGAWLTWQGYWTVGLMTAVAFLLDGLLSPPLRHHLFLSGISFVTTVILAIFHGDMTTETGPTLPVLLSSVVVAGLFLLVIATTRQVEAVGDATGQVLNPRRVRAAQILALLSALLLAWWVGAPGMMSVLPLWAAMAGVGLYRLAILFLSRNRQLRTEA
jgi:MFS family permease